MGPAVRRTRPQSRITAAPVEDPNYSGPKAAQQRGKKLLQAVAGIRPGSKATASWGVIRHQKVRVFAGLDSMKEMPAPEHRRGDDSDVPGTNRSAMHKRIIQRFTTEP